MRRVTHKKQGGFTLIELLIVIIILGILAAIVVFAIGSTRGDSVKATCQTDVKSIILAEEAYNTKNNVYTGTDTQLDTLKSFPTKGGSASNDNLFITLSGGGSSYTITISGKSYTAAKSVTNADTTDGAVNTACTTTA